MKGEFKKGDHVILTYNKYMSADIGATATVLGYKIKYSKKWLCIRWHKGNPLRNLQQDGGYVGNEFVKLRTRRVK